MSESGKYSQTRLHIQKSGLKNREWSNGTRLSFTSVLKCHILPFHPKSLLQAFSALMAEIMGEGHWGVS